jgi:hypothetical protein
MRRRILGGTILVTAASLLGPGCKSEEEEPGPTCKTTSTCPYDYSAFDSSEPVSFETDVFPLFRRSCGLSTQCHGLGPGEGAADMYLGPKLSDTETVTDSAFRQAIIDSLVNVVSQTVPGASPEGGVAGAAGGPASAGAVLVIPGDPENSFFMIKLDGCQSDHGFQCVKIKSNKTDFPCGERMPDGNLLCDDERDIIRRWIAQGAQNN